MRQYVSSNGLFGICLKSKIKIISLKFQKHSLSYLFCVPTYVIPAPGSAVIWLVTNTATLYSTNDRYYWWSEVQKNEVHKLKSWAYFIEDKTDYYQVLCQVHYTSSLFFPLTYKTEDNFYRPSEIFCSLESICASFCCLSASSPLPEKSTRNRAMIESIICEKLIVEGHKIK